MFTFCIFHRAAHFEVESVRAYGQASKKRLESALNYRKLFFNTFCTECQRVIKYMKIKVSVLPELWKQHCYSRHLFSLFKQTQQLVLIFFYLASIFVWKIKPCCPFWSYIKADFILQNKFYISLPGRIHKSGKTAGYAKHP